MTLFRLRNKTDKGVKGVLQFNGTSVYKGIAIGKIYKFKKHDYDFNPKKITDTEEEAKRFETARKQAIEVLKVLYESALEHVGREEAQIFEVHQLMLDDLDYVESVLVKIRTQKVNAEFAVHETGNEFAEIFSSMTDSYMKARATDILDISKKVVNCLLGISDIAIESKEPVIILAEDLTPSETVQMDKEKILAFVTSKGSANSHTAILARTLGIPSLVNIDMDILEEYNGKDGIVDGIQGMFYIEPDEEVAASLKERQTADLEAKEKLKALIGKETITKDGRKINLYANIGNAKDINKVIECDAGGIGLFRSEFIYLEKSTYPTEDEQYFIYKEVVSKMKGKKVIIRTLDIGADKQVDYFELEKEENPAMGFRAIRICLERIAIFKTQLRAIYRASFYGKTSVMFPMIISLSEITKIKEIVAEVKEELTKEAIPFGEVELGIMIETPAAVMISDLLAKEVQFFSIGTNDLTQYTLAIDRQNQKLDAFYNAHHEAVLRMIQMTIDNGHKEGIWVGICGELANDDTMTETFVKMGVDELSVSPTYVLDLRSKIRDINLK